MRLELLYKRRSGLVLSRFCPVCAAAWLFIFAPDPAAAQGRGPTRVEVLPAVEREVAPSIRLVGTVRPQLRTTVATEVAGLVTALPADEGVFVPKGELLCKLRDAPRRFARDEAVARLSQLKAALVVSQAELSKAKFEKERTERLWKIEGSTNKEHNDALADFEAAKGRVDQAKFSADAQRAVVDRLEDALSRTEIRAPYDGHVVTKHTEIGSWVDDGGGIVELVDLSIVRVRVNVPEAYIGFCDVGAEAYVSVDALDESFGGRISRVIPDADERARTFPIDIDIPNPTGRLRAGMFVRALVPSGPKANQLLIPKDAIVMRGPLQMIFVVRTSEKGQMAEIQPVEVLSEVLDYVAVKVPGLSAGDQVVVRGNERMMGPGPVIAIPRPDEPSPKSERPSEVHQMSTAGSKPARGTVPDDDVKLDRTRELEQDG